MDYKRFGRLNSKKIEELKNDSNLYDMGKFFPYLPTRSKSMDQRHTISSFKTMIKNYRYAYSLYPDCKASIKRPGQEYEMECIEIDNNVYVFTDISPYDFDEDAHDYFALLYDRDELIPIHNDENSKFNEMTNSILQNMEDRKLSPTQHELLREYLSQINFISLKSEYIKTNEMDEAVFNEFVWRMVLYGNGIYKESEIKKEADIKKKRSRVEDGHSLFQNYNRYGSLEYLHSFASKLDDAMQYKLRVTANKLLYEFIEENDNTFLLDEFTGNQLLSDALSIYEHNIASLLSLKENYVFLLNPYSKDYRQFFAKRKKLYSLFKSQQIMRKLRSEYHSINDRVNSLRKERDKTETSMNVIQEVIRNYKEDSGDNQLPNHGCGFLGDGWSNDDGTGGLMDEIREEAAVMLKLEQMERERREEDISMIAGGDIGYDNHQVQERGLMKQKQYKKLSPHEEYEIFKKNKIQELVKENQPLALFKFDNKKYFEYYDSISIKDAVTVCDWVLFDWVLFEGVSLEGEFFNYQEMHNWTVENTIPM